MKIRARLIYLCILLIFCACKVSTVKTYFQNGKIRTECENRNGKRNGVSKEYFESGQIKSIVNYENDEKNGVQNIYFDNGRVEIEARYSKDTLDGAFKEYSSSGKIKLVAYYFHGILYYQRDYDSLENIANIFHNVIIEAKDTLREGEKLEIKSNLTKNESPMDTLFKTGIVLEGQGAPNKYEEVPNNNGEVSYASEPLTAGNYSILVFYLVIDDTFHIEQIGRKEIVVVSSDQHGKITAQPHKSYCGKMYQYQIHWTDPTAPLKFNSHKRQ